MNTKFLKATTFACFALLTSSLYAFMPNPDLLTVSPAVAQAGTSIEINISGTHLDDIRALRFSDPRITAKAFAYNPDDIHPKGKAVPNRFTVTIPPDLAAGVYEVRALGYFGLSTARPFLIVGKDEGKEVREEGDHSSQETALAIEIDAGMIGTCDSKKIDWYRFKAKKGERLLIQVWAERLDSRADCLLAVYNKSGIELDSSRLHFGRDPLIDFTPTEDGEYFIALSDTLFRGSTQYFYRLKISTAPHLDFAFPPALQPAKKAQLTVYGRNLPGASLGENLTLQGKPIGTLKVEIQAPTTAETISGIFPGTPRAGMMPAFSWQHKNSNKLRIGLATAAVVVEQAGDAAFQKVSTPCEIAGRFDQPGDVDVYRFQAKKGQTLWLETYADRIGSATDTFIILEKIAKNDKGEETLTKVAESDDFPTLFARNTFNDLNVDTLDSALSFTAAEDGVYQLKIINQRASGSLAHIYRLAIRDAQHDFRLLVGNERTKTINNDAFPAASIVRRGGSMVHRIIALRQDGFEGDIRVEVSGLPKGVTARPLILSGKTREGFITIKAGGDVADWQGPIKISGTATLAGKPVNRIARSASIIWGIRVFANQRQVRSRLDAELVLSVVAEETEPSIIEPVENKTWTVELKQKLEIPIKIVDTGKRKGSLQVEVHGFPGVRTGPKVTIAEKKTDGTIILDINALKVKPGNYSFVLQGVGNASYQHNPAAAERAAVEVKRLEALGGQFAAEEKSAKTKLAQADAALAKAKKAQAGAADDKARAALTASTQAAQKKATDSKNALAAAQGKVKRLAPHKASAVKVAAATKKLATEKTNQFASFSYPINVVVKPVPEKEEPKK